MEPFLAIVGPTASGKTRLGLKLAQEQHAEMISVDSRQVYKHLRIGTAKPDGRWANSYIVEGVPYHLVDILNPDQSFSAADFVRLAQEKVREIQGRGRTPIFVGGTGLYFKALTEGLATLPQANAEIRSRLKAEADKKGRAHLHSRLQTLDPEAAQKIPANNIQRLVRALEVVELTGKPISTLHRDHSKTGLPLSFIGIDLGRSEIVRRITERAHAMMEGGMIAETQRLLDQGYSENCPALSGLGYPRVIALLKGKLSKEECLRLLIQDTRQYAKRQMTWFRGQLKVQWKKS